MNRIKGLRKKTGTSSYGNLVPFGTDGILVDMLSGLDNEEELKLGGNHNVSITTDGVTGNDVITEIYYKNNNDPHISADIAYTVESIIADGVSGTTITVSLWVGEKSGAAAKVKTITIPSSGTSISEVLS